MACVGGQFFCCGDPQELHPDKQGKKKKKKIVILPHSFRLVSLGCCCCCWCSSPLLLLFDNLEEQPRTSIHINQSSLPAGIFVPLHSVPAQPAPAPEFLCAIPEVPTVLRIRPLSLTSRSPNRQQRTGPVVCLSLFFFFVLMSIISD